MFIRSIIALRVKSQIMRSRSLFVLPAIAVLLVGALLGMKLESSLSGADTFDQLRKLKDAFVIINQQYVDDVSSDELAEDAIKGMLEALDPHSSYISREELADLQESYQGSFGGVGIWFEVLRDTARVISTIGDGPSEKAGVLAGDRIVAINDSSAVGLNSDEIRERLKGTIGSEVQMTVQRAATGRQLTLDITRDEIPLYTVDASFMVDDQTGYVRINRFAMTTYDEFAEAITDLQSQGMHRLVLDLRSNPGGIMETAVRMVDEMLGGDEMIVFTKGRDPAAAAAFRSRRGGAFANEPVIVLVNEFSASASEIVAGALQDHDRALVVGQRTFGKGLVQNQFPLPDGSMLQMTVARYYTPSGRLIQTPYEAGDQEEYLAEKFGDYNASTFDPAAYAESVPDSLKFETANGRLVFGGGGVLPDYVVPRDSAAVLRVVTGNGLDAVFSREWFADHEGALRERWTDRREQFIDDFTVSNEMWSEFLAFTEESGITITDDDSAVSVEDGIISRSQIAEYRPQLETYLRGRVAQELYGNRAWFDIYKSIDPELNAALGLWDRAEMLAAYHGG